MHTHILCSACGSPCAGPCADLAHRVGVFIGKEGWQSAMAYRLQWGIKVPPTAVQVSKEPGILASNQAFFFSRSFLFLLLTNHCYSVLMSHHLTKGFHHRSPALESKAMLRMRLVKLPAPVGTHVGL